MSNAPPGYTAKEWADLRAKIDEMHRENREWLAAFWASFGKPYHQVDKDDPGGAGS